MPEEGYYFVTHTPEQAKKWQDICTSDPERVVQVIQLIHASPATTQGDDTSDIFPALEALQKISKGKVFGGPPDPAWGPLVEQGLAEALCEAVLNMTTNFHPLPSMPKPMREKAANDVCFFVPNSFLGFSGICE